MFPTPSARAKRWEGKAFWEQEKGQAFLCLAQNHFLQEGTGSWGTSAEAKGAKGPDPCNRGLKPHQRCPCPFHVPVIFYLETWGHSLPFVFLDWGWLSLNSEGRKVERTGGTLHRKLIWRGDGGTQLQDYFSPSGCSARSKSCVESGGAAEACGDRDLLFWAQPILECPCCPLPAQVLGPKRVSGNGNKEGRKLQREGRGHPGRALESAYRLRSNCRAHAG